MMMPVHITAGRKTMCFFRYVENLDTRPSSPKWCDQVGFWTLCGDSFLKQFPLEIRLFVALRVPAVLADLLFVVFSRCCVLCRFFP